MKKIYVFTVALLIGAPIQAQEVFDFETPILASESYDNGENGTANFTNNQITLSNSFTGYWSEGFAFSNTTDVSTPGYTNMYSSYTGAGHLSNQYGVCYGNGVIQCENDQLLIEGFYVTNSTYAYLSMRDGDAFGKQFGSVNGADGMPDGTNGEDFFKIWVICENETGSTKDSVEFYLADFRFSDDNDDYIIDNWNYVDVSGMGFLVNKVSIRFESSDIGDFGMNTPAYVIVDDIHYSNIVGISEKTLSNVSMYPNPVQDLLTVSGEKGTITIRDLHGKVVNSIEHNSKSIIDFSEFKAGVYFVELFNEQGSYTQKIIK